MPSIDIPTPKKPSAPKPSAPKAPTAPPLLPPGSLTFAGMDKDVYPGNNEMLSISRTTNISWTGFYLTPSPSLGRDFNKKTPSEKSWMLRHDFLRSIGLGMAPIYVGRQIKGIKNADTRITPENGEIDGKDAAKLAVDAKFALGSVVYLDIESGAPLTSVVVAYYVAWAAALRTKGFLPGIYANSSIATSLSAFVPDGVVWTINLGKVAGKRFKTPFPQPNPSQSGTGNATHWQLKQGVTIEYIDALTGRKKELVVDLSSSLVSDPSVRARFG